MYIAEYVLQEWQYFSEFMTKFDGSFPPNIIIIKIKFG